MGVRYRFGGFGVLVVFEWVRVYLGCEVVLGFGWGFRLRFFWRGLVKGLKELRIFELFHVVWYS